MTSAVACHSTVQLGLEMVDGLCRCLIDLDCKSCHSLVDLCHELCLQLICVILDGRHHDCGPHNGKVRSNSGHNDRFQHPHANNAPGELILHLLVTYQKIEGVICWRERS